MLLLIRNDAVEVHAIGFHIIAMGIEIGIIVLKR